MMLKTELGATSAKREVRRSRLSRFPSPHVAFFRATPLPHFFFLGGEAVMQPYGRTDTRRLVAATTSGTWGTAFGPRGIVPALCCTPDDCRRQPRDGGHHLTATTASVRCAESDGPRMVGVTSSCRHKRHGRREVAGACCVWHGMMAGCSRVRFFQRRRAVKSVRRLERSDRVPDQRVFSGRCRRGRIRRRALGIVM
jgi:hypothetical protein